MIPHLIPRNNEAGTGDTGPRFIVTKTLLSTQVWNLAVTAKLRARRTASLSKKCRSTFSMLNIPAAFQSPHQRGVVGKLQMSAHGDAIGQAGHPDAEGL